ncbi:hypothetical protein OSTOST_07606 [Ostertagia ostertagi]
MEGRRTRGRPRIYLDESERLQIRRQRETPDERAARLEIDSIRHRQRRHNEDSEARNIRLHGDAERHQNRRQVETAEERASRLQEEADRQRQRRAMEDDIQRAARLEGNAVRERGRRELQSVEEQAARLEGNTQSQRRRRALENAEERASRLEENTRRQRTRRAQENVEERAARLEENTQRQRRRRYLESAEERNARLEEDAQRHRRSRESESIEERAARQERNTQRQRRRREQENVEERAARVDGNAQRQRRRREEIAAAGRHQRRRVPDGEPDQSNVPVNRRRRNGLGEFTGVALQTRVAQTNYLGELNQRCVDCGALHFASEDYLAGDDISGPPGNRVVLSSSHLGSPRAMQQAYQDAMAIVARTVYNIAVGRRRRVLCVAWTGIAANLLPGGRTANSVFKLNIADGNRTSSMRRQQKEAKHLMETDIIIWDEISMAPRTALEAVDVLLRDLMQVDTPFGGKVFVIGGDFRQILPVVEHGQREDIVDACVLKSLLWPLFRVHRLEVNMRARESGSDWRDRLLEIGNGQSNDEEGRTTISEEMMCTTDIVTEVFGEVLDPSATSALCENAILAPKNVHVQRLNDEALQRMSVDRSEDERIYKSIDEALYPEGESRQLFQMEYLHSLTPTGMPPHELHLKKGAIVMLLRNLDVANGLCNGTRLKVETLGRRTLACRFVCGERRDQLAIIPRIDNYWDQRTPFRLRRRQFPVRVAFAMTINKAQGQSFNKVGVFLPEDVFSHGQLYVALSRARTPNGIRVKSASDRLRNIVFDEVLF